MSLPILPFILINEVDITQIQSFSPPSRTQKALMSIPRLLSAAWHCDFELGHVKSTDESEKWMCTKTRILYVSVYVDMYNGHVICMCMCI